MARARITTALRHHSPRIFFCAHAHTHLIALNGGDDSASVNARGVQASVSGRAAGDVIRCPTTAAAARFARAPATQNKPALSPAARRRIAAAISAGGRVVASCIICYLWRPRGDGVLASAEEAWRASAAACDEDLVDVLAAVAAAGAAGCTELCIKATLQRLLPLSGILVRSC